VAFLWLGRVLYEALGQSRLAEFSARSMHLEQGTQELGREGVKLTQTYHRARRELIDRSMRELFAARGVHG